MVQRTWRQVRRFQEATRLGPAGLAWLGVALATVAGALAVLSAAAEDVTRRNGMEAHDAVRLHWFIAHRSGPLDALARAITHVGSPAFLVGVALLSGAWLWRRGQHLIVAAAPALALGIAGLTATVAKAAVGRQRPPVRLHLVTETEPSFPSGHATDSTAVYLALALVIAVVVLRSPRARAAVVGAAGALAGAIGLSRLVLGVHWPSDVIAGWSLGLAVAVVVATAAVLVARTQPDPAGASVDRRRLLGRAHALALTARRRPLAFGA
ncbi:MAG: phosphatase PAP2 family protein [Acidimicrobiales bacterium]